MTNKPKRIGTSGESAVVAALHRLHVTDAKRVVQHGRYDHGDVHALMWDDRPFVFEIKSGDMARNAAMSSKSKLVGDWYAQAVVECLNANGWGCAVVMQTKGCGKAEDWWCATPLAGVLVRVTLRDLITYLEEQ